MSTCEGETQTGLRQVSTKVQACAELKSQEQQTLAATKTTGCQTQVRNESVSTRMPQSQSMVEIADVSARDSFASVDSTQQKELDYLKNRDPMKEFFLLTCQSVKLGSPHMAQISEVSEEAMYKLALHE